MLPLKNFDKNGAIWCILSVRKLVIIKPKIIFFGDNKSTTQILCQIFLQDQSRRALWHQNKYIHTLQGGSGEAIAPRSQRSVKIMEALRFSYHARRYIL